MTKGGVRPNAGRKAGVPNRVTTEKVERAKIGGIMPLDYLLTVMRNEACDLRDRVDAAKAAAPYLHSKMPIAMVPPQSAAPSVRESDEEILNTYLGGIHAEADQD